MKARAKREKTHMWLYAAAGCRLERSIPPAAVRCPWWKKPKEDIIMSVVSIKQLLEAGVHFGHHTRRWNPKMAEYIFTERNGIYIIDLQKTIKKFDEAYMFILSLIHI